MRFVEYIEFNKIGYIYIILPYKENVTHLCFYLSTTIGSLQVTSLPLDVTSARCYNAEIRRTKMGITQVVREYIEIGFLYYTATETKMKMI